MKIEVKNCIKPIDYEKSMLILEKRVKNVLLGKENEFLWVIEHTPVYTAGTSSKEHDLLDKKIKVIKTNRGGKYTFHGPGQKVVYFVLNLNKRGKDIRKLISNIETCIINILKDYKIMAYTDKKNIGIWINNGNDLQKIASIGIKVKNWIAYHGFSINVYNDLTKFNKIIPCGIKDKKITSLKEIGIKNYENIEDNIVKNFLNVFR
tara:strand:- start:1493 stop:2110 length:618 start_codon:yes stop_codon:yes gene_type:complete